MHPRIFLDSFWRNDISNEVFVAMSFKPEFERRWTDIFQQAIEQVSVEGQQLKAVRVDIRKSGDSILTEIMNFSLTLIVAPMQKRRFRTAKKYVLFSSQNFNQKSSSLL